MPDRITPGVSYSGAAISVFAGLTLTEWGILVGIVTAIATFGINVWYQHRRDQRDQKLVNAKLSRLGAKEE